MSDDEEYSANNFLGITPENFKPIYLPMFISMFLFGVGVVIFLLTDNTKLFRIIFGLTGMGFSLSGLGMIKMKNVPGFPFLQGGGAVIFGIFFFLIFMFFGIGVIFFE